MKEEMLQILFNFMWNSWLFCAIMKIGNVDTNGGSPVSAGMISGKRAAPARKNGQNEGGKYIGYPDRRAINVTGDTDCNQCLFCGGGNRHRIPE
ncbi:MAG: hypothetical protein IJP04_14050 [Clostridia bacterium]|nr:hypothetical protein [Clostridia bacterium]